MKKQFFMLIALLLTATAFAEIPAGYYSSAEGSKGENLRQALYKKISSHTKVSYDGLWSLYETTDTKNGKILDMYSTCDFTYGDDQCGTYKSVCACYNREHSIPKSWFNNASPMSSDAFHVYPTDGKVNNQRDNYEFGECSGGEKLSSKALGKLGSSTFSGYTNRGTVFEPDDEYKGDFARTYFYMATCYADKCSNWGNTFGNISGLDDYGVALFMKWHRQDPVSQKEIDRNEAVYKKQKNRNPFIDHPELAEHIWGNNKSEAWYESASALEMMAFSELAVFPNPAGEFVTISAEVPELRYTILTLSGQMLSNGNVASGESISVSALANGMYLLKLEADGKTQLEKLIVNK